MLKKTTLLSIATAAAVITTSVGTFAAYDTVEATTTGGTVTFRNPVTVTAGELTMNETDNQLNTNPSASGTVTFTVTDAEKLATQLDLEINVTDNGGKGLDANDFDFTVTDSSDSEGTSFSGSEIAWTDTDLSDSNEYTIKATLNETGVAKLDGAAPSVEITVTGTLS